MGIIKLRMTTSLTVAAAIAVVLMTLLTVAAPASGTGALCSKNDIMVVQSQGPPEFKGIPTYLVQITNKSPTGKSILDIHLSCGWFSSAKLVNPEVFRRLKYNDCLVNHGQPLLAGYTISFKYYTTFKYPLSVSSIVC